MKAARGSLLRLLSPIRAGSSSAKSEEIPSLTLHVADYGSILIQTSDAAAAATAAENEAAIQSYRSTSSSSSNSTSSSTGAAPQYSGSSSGPTRRGTGTGTEDGINPPVAERTEYELSGTLEITIPQSMGKRRIKAIRVMMIGMCRLDMGKAGKGRGWEEDEIFKRKVEIRGGDSDGIILEPGSQVFSFTLLLPEWMPVHDWHTQAHFGLTLYGEIEGLIDQIHPSFRRTSPPGSSKARSKSSTPFQQRSPSASTPGTPRSRSRTPVPNTKRNNKERDESGGVKGYYPWENASYYSQNAEAVGSSSRNRSFRNVEDAYTGGHDEVEEENENDEGNNLSSLATRLEEISITRQVLPKAPPYERTQTPNSMLIGSEGVNGNWPRNFNDNVPWLKDICSVNRPFEVLYNPNPGGGLAELNARFMGEQPGVGAYHIEFLSAMWTVCAPIQVRLNILAIPPTATIFCVRISLTQKCSLFSPRDPPDTPPTIYERTFKILQEGDIPPRNAVSDKSNVNWKKGLWRGKEAGGEDWEELKLDLNGRLPADDVCRPSAVPQMKSPIRASHTLITDIFFSVYGEDEMGRTMDRPGEGGLRILHLVKDVIVPTCAMTPLWMQPPDYYSDPTHPPGPCPHKPLQSDWAKDAKEYKPDLECSLCKAGVPPLTGPGWRDCACGIPGEEREERGRRLNEAPMVPTKGEYTGESLQERERREEGGIVERMIDERRGRQGR